MKKILFIFAAMVLGSVGLHAGNTITYKAWDRLVRRNGELEIGATTFGPAIKSHTFSNGTGTITCDGTITKIGDNAFYECNNMSAINIPNSVTTIGQAAFSRCGLTSITIPNSVTQIGAWAFDGCSGLTSITIPNSVTMIEEFTFAGCSGLTSITIPNSVTKIGNKAFYQCSGLTSVTIPHSVTTIGIEVFRECSSLKSIEIPSSVTSIEYGVFCNCTALTSVTVNWTDAQSIVSNLYVFEGIANGAGPQGATLYVPKGTLNLYKQANVWKDFGHIIDPATCTISYTDSEQLEGYRGILTVGSTVFGPVIKSHTFSNGTGTITCDGTITKIGENAFYECSNMSAINIPNSVTTIEDVAFYWCASLTSITIPPLVTKIGGTAFYECYNMSAINIPNSVTTIEDNAFLECRSLKTVYCYAVTPPKLGNNVFKKVPQDLSVYVLDVEAYKNAWGAQLPASCFKPMPPIVVGDLKYEFFDGNKARVVAKDGGYAGNVVIPEQITYEKVTFTVTEIAQRAFGECKSMTSVTIPNSVTTIGKQAFYICSGLTSITIPQSVTTIEEQAFEGSSTSLTSIVVAGGNPKYDSRDNCNAIIEKATNTLILGCKYTKIPNNITTIGRSAFDGCSDLKDITIPNSVTTIGRSAFWECKSLTSVTIPNSVTTIGINAFAGAGLTSITIPASVKKINEHAFWDCPNLEDLLFADQTGALNIGTYAFEKCPNLKYIFSMSETPPALAEGAFKGHDKDDKVIVYVPTPDATFAYKNSKWGDYFANYISNVTYKITTPTTVEVVHAIPANGAVNLLPVVTLQETNYTVVGIGNEALKGDTSLRSISLPATIQYIGNEAFSGCTKLKQTNSRAWEDLQTIGASAFYGCSALDSIVIPEGVQTIGKSAFMGCSNLTSISLPTGLKNIPDECFNQCPLGQEIIVPEGVETIGQTAFNGTKETQLRTESITLPSTLKEINFGAFYYRDGLKEIICHALTPPTLTAQAFASKQFQAQQITVYVPNRDVVTAYKRSNWGDSILYNFKFSDLMAEANKQYLYTVAGDNEEAKAIAKAYCDSIDRATTTQQVQYYINTALTKIDKYTLNDYKIKLANYLDSVAGENLDALRIAEEYRKKILLAIFRQEAEKIFAEGLAKINAVFELIDFKKACCDNLRNSAQNLGKEIIEIAEEYCILINQATTKEEANRIYLDGAQEISMYMQLSRYWKEPSKPGECRTTYGYPK